MTEIGILFDQGDLYLKTNIEEVSVLISISYGGFLAMIEI